MQPTALILEDSKTQALIIGKMIEAQGWAVVHCETVREALDCLKLVSIQALFLDVFVSQHNTLLHMDMFRKAARNTPIAVMTAGSSREAIEETLKAARKVGADFVLRKPFNDAILTDIFTVIGHAGKGRKKHVLVIDDSRTVRMIAKAPLVETGYRVSEAESMEEAFTNVDIAHVDLVLCDIFMPGMGGLKGMRQIKQTWPSVKVISMSGGIDGKVSEHEALDATRRFGADGQLLKPFTSQALIEIVQVVLEGDGLAA
jgi:CheY-like chemotaxis protein